MSCFGLPPAKKAWKRFTTKLQTKLHKLQRRNSIKKPKKNQFYAKTAKAMAIEQRKTQRFVHVHIEPSRYHKSYLLRKKSARSAPVYVDGLFNQPTTIEVVERKHQTSTSGSAKNVKVIVDEDHQAGSSKEFQRSDHDDMWESVTLASPQMNGIDQRAEDFIRKFRADMKHQEIMARGCRPR